MEQISTSTGCGVKTYWFPIGREAGNTSERSSYHALSLSAYYCELNPIQFIWFGFSRRRVVVNYACHLQALVRSPCSPSLHTLLERCVIFGLFNRIKLNVAICMRVILHLQSPTN
jgi:hypothetical protein